MYWKIHCPLDQILENEINGVNRDREKKHPCFMLHSFCFASSDARRGMQGGKKKKQTNIWRRKVRSIILAVQSRRSTSETVWRVTDGGHGLGFKVVFVHSYDRKAIDSLKIKFWKVKLQCFICKKKKLTKIYEKLY